jgi:hypothetical protein
MSTNNLIFYIIIIIKLVTLEPPTTHFKNNNMKSIVVATLILGLRPRQGLARVQDKREPLKAHLILSGVQENVKE